MFKKIVGIILKRKARKLATTTDELAIRLILMIAVGKPKLPE